MEEKQKVRVELFKEQVDMLLNLLEKNEPSEEDVEAYDAWWFSKMKLKKASQKFDSE